MKRTGILAVAAAAMLVVNGLCACGGGAAAPAQTTAAAAAAAETTAAQTEAKKESEAAEAKETTAAKEETKAETSAETKEAAPETKPAKEFSVDGEYKLFGVYAEGFTVNAAEMEMSSVLKLEKGGTGSMSMDTDEMAVSKWEDSDGTVTITMEDESSAEAKFHDGILEMDIFGTGDMIMYYAQEEADISGYELLTLEQVLEKRAEAEAGKKAVDSKVGALWQTLDTKSGVHMNYSRTIAKMNAEQKFDVQGRDGVYYSSRTSKTGSLEGTTITFFEDGKLYNLDPRKKTGVIATTTSSDIVSKDVMRLDDLYKAIGTSAESAEFTEETREIDGTTYAAEVFPAGDYTPEGAFCFNDSGELVYYIEGTTPAKKGIDNGEIVYKINAIDTKIDEELFDISGYKID
ncbi:MAG: hypothetical protein IKI35_06315 [Stomatobaculum sp.]|nr:hypothetical protein [Stomatobaculum sp.]MBR7058326.1 hypothetical protein [Stomatobaculum sp.]